MIKDPDLAISLRPGLELNIFVFEYVLGLDVQDVIHPKPGHSTPHVMLPDYSKSLDALKPIIGLMSMRGDNFTWSYGAQWFDRAKFEGFVLRKTECGVYAVSGRGRDKQDMLMAFGRTLAEAICKLAILMRKNEHLE